MAPTDQDQTTLVAELAKLAESTQVPAPPSIRQALDKHDVPLPPSTRRNLTDFIDPEIDATISRGILGRDGHERTTQIDAAVDAGMRRRAHFDRHDDAMRPFRSKLRRLKDRLQDRHVHCPRTKTHGRTVLVEFEDGHTEARSTPMHCDSHSCHVCGPHAEHRELERWADALDDAYAGPIYAVYTTDDEDGKYTKAIGRIDGAGYGRTPLTDGRVLVLSTHPPGARSPLAPMQMMTSIEAVELVFDQVETRHRMARETGERKAQRQRLSGAWLGSVLDDDDEVANSSSNRKPRTTCQTWIEKAEAEHGKVAFREALITTSTSQTKTREIIAWNGGDQSLVKGQKHARHHRGFVFHDTVKDLRRAGYSREEDVRAARAEAAVRRQFDAFTDRMHEQAFASL